jgi:ketosteroid isomerase-like protein
MTLRPVALASVGRVWKRRESVAERAALLSRFNEAWETRDLDALMELMSDDCRFRASIGPEPGVTFEGPDEVRRGFALFLGQAPAAGTQPSGTVTEPPLISEDFAVTRWTTNIPRPDRPLVVSACDIFTFVGTRIACKDTYRKISGALPAV